MTNPSNDHGAPSPFDGARPFCGGGAEFPNGIASVEPLRAPLAPRYALLLALMLAALAPRLVMALLIPTVCSDGTTYIAAAEAIERDGLRCGAGYHLNLYPLILTGLHRVGFSWEIAGKAWGVLCSVLVVAPLFGWVRRQFDDRVGAFACLLYAAHPKLIEWAPELIREQTFWLFFVSGLYFSWRAAAEVRFTHYFAAAFALAAATFTRFEGLFLFIPLVYWTTARFFSLRSQRGRLVAIFALTFLAAPGALLLVQIVWLQKAPLAQFFNSGPVERLIGLAGSFLGGGDANVAAHEFVVPGARPGPLSLTVIGKTCQVVARGLTAPFGVLLLLGLISQGRRSLKSDRLPAVLLALTTIGAIWVHTWYAGLASSRYILTVALFSTGTAAVGLLESCRLLAAAAGKVRIPSQPRWAVAALAAGMFIFGCCDAFNTNYAGRVDKAALGTWIRERCGEQCMIYGSEEQLDLIAYYAHARCVRLPTNRATIHIDQEVNLIRPDIVVLSNPPLSADACRALTDSATHLGMSEVDVPKSIMRRPIVMTADKDRSRPR
jgi:hypothetical protein